MIDVVLCNCPENVSDSLARTLVEEGLVACVNVIPGVRSYYRWEGALHVDAEHTLLMKTAPGRWGAVKARIEELHPYSTPEIVRLGADQVNESYLKWVLEMTELK